MPQLIPYTSKADSFRADDRGIDARDRAGRRIAGFYATSANEQEQAARAEAGAAGDVAQSVTAVTRAVSGGAAQLEDYLGRREISQGAAEAEKMFADLNAKWNDKVKNAAKGDPNDPTVAASFRETELEERLQKFAEAYGTTPKGQEWAQSYVNRARHHFFEKTSADMATLAGIAATTNIAGLRNAASNTAHSNPDFHTVGFLMSNVQSQVDAIVDASPNLKGPVAEKLRTELTFKMREDIVKAGAVGAIAKSANPEKTAEAWTAKYPDLLSGVDAKQLAANARAQVRAARVDENYARHNAELEKKRVSEEAENETLKIIYGDDPKKAGGISTRNIVNDDRLTNPTKEKLIRIVERELKPETAARVSAVNSTEAFRRIHLPEGDPEKITDIGTIDQMRIEGKISKTDHHDLRKEMIDARSPEGQRVGEAVTELIKGVKPSIDKSNPLMGKLDQDGAWQLYRFQQDLKRKIAEYKKAGRDPHDLLDASKPDFFGKPENLKGYQKTIAQSQADIAARMTGRAKPTGNLTGDGSTITGITVTNAPPKPVDPKKPGESAADYLKRKDMN